MNNNLMSDLIKSFESTSKGVTPRYNDFLAHVYMTFDKKISLCKSNKEMNKYKQMRVSVLRYIVSNEKEIRSKICK